MEKYAHFMINDEFNAPFVKFLNQNFNPEKHVIFCKKVFKDIDMPEGPNVFEVKTYKQVNLNKYKKIFCHSLFNHELIYLLYNNKKVLNNTYWIVWGGDLYNPDMDNLQARYVKGNVNSYLLFAKDDKKIIEEKYKIIPTRHRFFSIEYPLSISPNEVNNLSVEKGKTIQINNSADYSTFDILYKLAKYKREIKVQTVTSYGNMKYADEIKKVGREIFGNNFIALDSYLDAEDYLKFLSQADVYIANQNRQQGTANIDMFLLLGKKVYIKSNISTYDNYKKLGFHINDTNSLEKLNLNEIFYDQYAERNKIKAKIYTSIEYRKKMWDLVFNHAHYLKARPRSTGNHRSLT